MLSEWTHCFQNEMANTQSSRGNQYPTIPPTIRRSGASHKEDEHHTLVNNTPLCRRRVIVRPVTRAGSAFDTGSLPKRFFAVNCTENWVKNVVGI
mmetsp:Transcript_22415/g.44791  ORF Transcript_22415/g.44791 Transcript_22415/m.44791 type:complete len:95 (-) Transcript_22415:536-820(-)